MQYDSSSLARLDAFESYLIDGLSLRFIRIWFQNFFVRREKEIRDNKIEWGYRGRGGGGGVSREIFVDGGKIECRIKDKIAQMNEWRQLISL